MNGNDRWSHMVSLALLALASYALISLIGFDPADSSRLVYSATSQVSAPTAKVANPCGRFGALLAERLLFLLGKAAYALVGLVAVWALLMSSRVVLPEVWARVTGSALGLFALATLVSLRGTVDSATMPGAGGLFGEAAAGYLAGKFGGVGTVLIATVVMLISFVLAGETLLVPGFQRIGAVLGEAADKWNEDRRRHLAAMREQFERTREKREETRAMRDAERAQRVALREVEEEERRAEREAEKSRVRAEKEAAREAARLKAEEEAERKKVEEAERKAAREAEKREAAEVAAQGAPEEKEKPKPKPAREPAKRVAAKTEIAPPQGGPYQLPPLELLEPIPTKGRSHKNLAVEERAELLEQAFLQFGIEAKVVRITQGPTIAQFECELGAGIKLAKVTALSNDVAMAMQATSVRIVAPLPGKGTFGVEIPNDSREIVRFRELLEARAGEGMSCPLVLGKTIDGTTLCCDLAKMPHLLIAGTTGSGKSFCINSIIVSLLYHKRPDELKFILVDPKQVELAPFSRIPHLIAPTVTDPEKAAGVLDWAVGEMERRYHVFKQVGCRGITSYQMFSETERIERWLASGESEDSDPGPMPYIVIVIDELADLMYTASKEVETSICRLAQKSRAAGLHLVLATQRPSVDVVTGLIKANLPCRLSFRVNSSHDSKVILDGTGADKLLGKGDMLFRSPENEGLARAQGAYISDDEVSRVVEYVASQAQPLYCEELLGPKLDYGAGGEDDPLFDEAVRIVLEQQRGSASLLQRALAIGYTRASRLIDMMEERGLLGAHKGSKSREILITLEDWIQLTAGATEESAAPDA